MKLQPAEAPHAVALGLGLSGECPGGKHRKVA